jgi:hypothetical protein
MSKSQQLTHKKKMGKKSQKEKGTRSVVVRADQFHQLFPPVLRCKFSFEKSFKLVNIASPFGNVRFSPSYLYDVDPTLGSTAMPGFNEVSGLYTKYRFRTCKWKCSFSNQEAFALTACVDAVNGDPTVNTANYQAYFSSESSQEVVVGAQGCPTEKMKGFFTIDKFGGGMKLEPPPLDAYVGAGTTSPANNIFVFVGFTSPTGQVSTAAGIAVSFKMTVHADFFEIASPLV